MYQEIRATALTGQNVVVDSLTHLGDNVDCLSSLSELKDLNVMFVLVYCPWKNLVERIEQRNKSADKKNRRELDWALSNFAHYFDASAHHHPHAIDAIQGDYVKEVVAVYAHPQYKKRGLKIMNETKKASLQLFKTGGTQYIYPRLAYDLIINTKEYNPTQAATIVLDFFHSYNPTKKFTQIKQLSCHVLAQAQTAPVQKNKSLVVMRPITPSFAKARQSRL